MQEIQNLKCAACGINVKMPVSGTFTFMRHGQTDFNLRNLSVGTIDEPINDTGRRQIRDAAEQMKKDGLQFDLIITSPLCRAHESATIVGDMLGVKVKVSRLLLERCVGIQEGQPETPDSDAQWLRYDYTLKGAESLLNYEAKIRELLSMAKRRWYDKRILFVTHGFWLLTAVKFIKGLTIEEVMKFEPPYNAGMITFTLGNLCPRSTCGSEFYEANL